MLKPDLRVQSVAELTPEVLDRLGVDALLVDMDDTLIASDAEVSSGTGPDWLAGIAAAGKRAVVLSNGTRERVAQLSRLTGVTALPLSGKPFPWSFRRGLAALGDVTRERVAMVGDQLFTDVLGAKRAGLKTVLVRPLTKGKLPHTRLVRHVERMVLKEY